MSKYPLFVITYDRGKRWDEPTKEKPYHWAFFVQTSTTWGPGCAFQLRGMPGGFHYSAEETMDITKSGSQKAELEVGSVPVEKYERFKQLLEEVPIDNVESSGWNCQNWSLTALDRLRAEGFIAEECTNNVIQHWLREDQ